MAIFWQEQYLDSSGNPYSGAKIYHYEPGTTTAKDGYTDSDEAVAVAQPLVADSAGTASMFLKGAYRLIIKTSDDVTIYDYDNVNLAWDAVIPAQVIDGAVTAGTFFETISGTFPATYDVNVSTSWPTTFDILSKTTTSFKISYGTQVPTGDGTRSYTVIKK